MRILLISGSLRAGSTNAAALKTALTLAAPEIEAELYDGLGSLPLFNPDDDREPLPPPVARLRGLLDGVDAVFFSTPEYAGSLPGSFKNLLDWTVGGGLHQKRVGWINPSNHGGSEGTYATLRTVLGFIGATIVEDACVKIAVLRDMVDLDGVIAEEDVRTVLKRALTALANRT
jgi:NAD(P)H-dependent FMN reductase